ncbi:chromatin modification-related protein EAF7-like [Chenopodium quinoa]|uniref:chromatin modification-related protein EAF7-like n=1 Tax=Chenopodium quinoa TaxID=63459 RepID=UPI000B785D66|nr:chromatin modification-related protein EAF7-like [Chenopodium quinoa]
MYKKNMHYKKKSTEASESIQNEDPKDNKEDTDALLQKENEVPENKDVAVLDETKRQPVSPLVDPELLKDIIMSSCPAEKEISPIPSVEPCKVKHMMKFRDGNSEPKIEQEIIPSIISNEKKEDHSSWWEPYFERNMLDPKETNAEESTAADKSQKRDSSVNVHSTTEAEQKRIQSEKQCNIVQEKIQIEGKKEKPQHKEKLEKQGAAAKQDIQGDATTKNIVTEKEKIHEEEKDNPKNKIENTQANKSLNVISIEDETHLINQEDKSDNLEDSASIDPSEGSISSFTIRTCCQEASPKQKKTAAFTEAKQSGTPEKDQKKGQAKDVSPIKKMSEGKRTTTLDIIPIQKAPSAPAKKPVQSVVSPAKKNAGKRRKIDEVPSDEPSEDPSDEDSTDSGDDSEDSAYRAESELIDDAYDKDDELEDEEEVEENQRRKIQ